MDKPIRTVSEEASKKKKKKIKFYVEREISIRERTHTHHLWNILVKC